MRYRYSFLILSCLALSVRSPARETYRARSAADDEPIALWIEQLGGVGAAVAAKELAAIYPQSRPALLRACSDRLPARRRWSVRLLGETGDRKNQEKLRQAALFDRSAQVRIIAIQALARHRDFPLVELLSRCLGREWNPANQRTILRMIAMRRDRSAIGAILDAIEVRFDERTRRIAFRWLRSMAKIRLADDLGLWRRWWERYRASKQERGSRDR